VHRILDFLLRHGYWILFGMVLAEQLGAPLPAIPVLLAMGALIGAGNFSFTVSISLAVVAAVAADTAWYVLGKQRGHSVLALLCRISLEPDSCVSTTRYWFKRLGGWALVIAKFFPGLSTVAPPMAGLSRMRWLKFLAADTAGSILWSGAFLGIGYAFREQLEDAATFALRMGGWLGALMGGSIVAWIAWKYWQRRRFIRNLRIARIKPEELLAQLATSVIVDLRSSVELDYDGFKLPGALWFDRTELEQRQAEIPRDRDVILYCT
jgi:membrane protein DedA with SNARE-associated domain